MAIRAYWYDDSSVAGSSPSVSSTLTDIIRFSMEMNLERNIRKRAWCYSNLLSAISTPPTHLPLLCPGGLSLFSVPLRPGRICIRGDRHAFGSTGDLVGGACKSGGPGPKCGIILLDFCVGLRLNYWLHSRTLQRRVHQAAKNDRHTIATVERMLHCFGLQRPSTPERQAESQVSLPTHIWGLGLTLGRNVQPRAVVAAWSNVISRLIPLGYCALGRHCSLCGAESFVSFMPTLLTHPSVWSQLR